MKHFRVAAVKTADYSGGVIAGSIEKALALLGGLDQFVQKGDKVLLKPNLLEGVPVECAVTTHPEVLRAMIRQVKALGAIPIVGDSPGVSGTIKAAEKCGIASVCREESVELVPFDVTAE